MADTAQHGGSGGEESRRDFLYILAGATGAVGAAAAVWPLISSMNPAKDTLALATTDVDLSLIELGQRVTVVWQQKPVFVEHRTEEAINAAREVDPDDLIDPQTDEERVQKAEWLVAIGVCTHLGCIPKGQKTGDARGEYKGWFCPCHGSHYDTSGRIRKGPAPRNLEVPPYQFNDDTSITIG